MTPREKVVRFVERAGLEADGGLDRFVRSLVRVGLTPEDAECLVAFVPMAFAWVLLSPMGVQFQETFLVRDVDTGETAQGMLADEPLYVAAIELAQEMTAGDDKAKSRFKRIARTSAEYDACVQLSNGNLHQVSGGQLTEAALVRVPLSHLAGERRRVESSARSAEISGRFRRFLKSLVG